MAEVQVSIIVPNYNHAPYLSERIESLLAQTYPHFEIILLDDCSTDNSVEILNSYRHHPKISQLVINSQNSGSTFKQWARGIELARGEWVWIAESDDWCEPTLLQTLVEGINDNSAYSFCQSLMIRENEVVWSLKADYLQKTYDGREFVKGFMLKECRVYNASMCIFKKDLYYRINKNFTTYRLCGDWLFWILLAQFGDVFSSGKVLNYFRKHKDDVSGMAGRQGILYKEYIKLLSDLLANNIIEKSEHLYLLKYKLNQLLLDTSLATDIKTGIVPLYYAALKGKLLNRQSYSVFGKRLFAYILLDKIRGKAF